MVKDWSMSRSEWQRFNYDKKIFDNLQYNRYKCSCGHTVMIGNSQPRALCTHCNHWVYKDPIKQIEQDIKSSDEDAKVKRIKFKKELLKRL